MTPTLTPDQGEMSQIRGQNPPQVMREQAPMAFTSEAVRCEMQQRVRDIAGLAADDSRKTALVFAAAVLRMPFDRVRRLFYGQARRIEAHEADQIRAYVDQAQDLIQRRAEYEAERARFIAEAHPALAALAPPSIADKQKRRRG